MDKYFHKLYKEPYRNQFHYSPPYGWLNDINGLWYIDGVYHLTYQHSVDGLECYADHIDVGHAYSKDLIHWYASPLAVSCGRQCKSGVWSGTAYVDKDNHAGFGKNSVIMANTDMKNGQYITVSTDGGWTFEGIEENPVVVLPEELKSLSACTQRDPKIFWLESEQCFIMVVYLAGCKIPLDENEELEIVMDFYSSKDMKNWSFFQRLGKNEIAEDLEKRGKDASHIKDAENFPHECPNLFQMECNGEKHWILYSGDSRYVIGKFDGLHYTVTHAPLEPLSYGPSIYAGQTFENTKRHIAMFWLEKWRGSTVDTFPFRNSVTVASELTLKETPEGLRVYRLPVEELSSIYESTTKITSASGKYSAPYFDAEFVIDWNKTTSETVTIKISEKIYVLKRNSFYAEHIQEPKSTGIQFNEDITTVRILVDRDSVEMFFNNGRKSYTEEYGFKSDILDFSLVPEQGNSLSVNGAFHTLKSIWD